MAKRHFPLASMVIYLNRHLSSCALTKNHTWLFTSYQFIVFLRKSLAISNRQRTSGWAPDKVEFLPACQSVVSRGCLPQPSLDNWASANRHKLCAGFHDNNCLAGPAPLTPDIYLSPGARRRYPGSGPLYVCKLGLSVDTEGKKRAPIGPTEGAPMAAMSWPLPFVGTRAGRANHYCAFYIRFRVGNFVFVCK